MSYLWHPVVFLLSYEVFTWGCKLNQHARDMQDIEDKTKDICAGKLWSRIFMSSVMATALSMGVAIWWLAMIITGAAETFVYPQWVACGIQLSHIHFFAIIARCTYLEVDSWPLLSRHISYLLYKCGFFDDDKN